MKEERKKSDPEKHFKKAIAEYFSFHKNFFKDEDGYALAPDWNGLKRGMELKALKLLLETLRTIREGKGVEWVEEVMVEDFNRFMQKAMNHNLCKKDFRISMLNRFKIEIISASYNPNLAKKILEVWYFVMPDYARDFSRDMEAAEGIIKFLKEQYVISSIEFTEQSALSSVKTIFANVKTDEWWNTKPLKSVVKNIQEFVTRIKQNKNGQRTNTKTDGINIAFNQAFGRDQAS